MIVREKPLRERFSEQEAETIDTIVGVADKFSDINIDNVQGIIKSYQKRTNHYPHSLRAFTVIYIDKRSLNEENKQDECIDMYIVTNMGDVYSDDGSHDERNLRVHVWFTLGLLLKRRKIKTKTEEDKSMTITSRKKQHRKIRLHYYMINYLSEIDYSKDNLQLELIYVKERKVIPKIGLPKTRNEWNPTETNINKVSSLPSECYQSHYSHLTFTVQDQST